MFGISPVARIKGMPPCHHHRGLETNKHTLQNSRSNDRHFLIYRLYALHGCILSINIYLHLQLTWTTYCGSIVKHDPRDDISLEPNKVQQTCHHITVSLLCMSPGLAVEHVIVLFKGTSQVLDGVGNRCVTVWVSAGHQALLHRPGTCLQCCSSSLQAPVEGDRIDTHIQIHTDTQNNMSPCLSYSV